MKEVTEKDLRQFGITLGVILGTVGLVHFMKGHVSACQRFLVLSALSVIAGLFVPGILKPVYIVFIKIAHAIGWFNTRVILAFLYFFILTPIGLIARLLGKDPMDRKIDKKKESYWHDHKCRVASRESLERQF